MGCENPQHQARRARNERDQGGIPLAPSYAKPIVVSAKKHDVLGLADYESMLKRISSLALVLMVGLSVFAGTLRLSRGHVCSMTGEIMPSHTAIGTGMKMSGMEGMSCADMSDMGSMSEIEIFSAEDSSDIETPDVDATRGMDMSDMDTMPCCRERVAVTVEFSRVGDACCISVPQETDSTTTTINLRSPSFSIVAINPAVMLPTLSPPKPSPSPHVTQLFLPNLQGSYVRHLSFLI